MTTKSFYFIFMVNFVIIIQYKVFLIFIIFGQNKKWMILPNIIRYINLKLEMAPKPQNLPEKEKPKGKSNKKLITYINLPIMLTASYFVMHFTSHPAAKKIIQHFLPITDLATTEGQFNFFVTLMFYLACILLTLSITIMLMRILLGKSASVIDSGLIGTLNRIIQNSIQQFLIFSGIYLYILRNDGFGFNNQQLHRLGSWFLIARVLFSFGYILGHFSGIQTFRSCGFGINLATTITMLVKVFGGYHVLTYINW